MVWFPARQDAVGDLQKDAPGPALSSVMKPSLHFGMTELQLPARRADEPSDGTGADPLRERRPRPEGDGPAPPRARAVRATQLGQPSERVGCIPIPANILTTRIERSQWGWPARSTQGRPHADERLGGGFNLDHFRAGIRTRLGPDSTWKRRILIRCRPSWPTGPNSNESGPISTSVGPTSV